MDVMDVKPGQSQPEQQNTTPAQDEFVSPRGVLKDDPFKPDAEPPKLPAQPGSVNQPKKGGPLKVILTVLLGIVLVVAAAGGVYYWQQQKVKQQANQIQNLNGQINTLQGQVNDLEAAAKKAAATTTVSTDDLVIAAAKASCQAAVDPSTYKALIYTQGTVGTTNKKVTYASDKTYALTTANCGQTANQANSTKSYYLKLSGSNWVVIYAGTTAPDSTTVKNYAIPTTFN